MECIHLWNLSTEQLTAVREDSAGRWLYIAADLPVGQIVLVRGLTVCPVLHAAFRTCPSALVRRQ